MITTVTQKNMVTIPIGMARHFGITPGCKLDWEPVPGKEEMRVKVLPRRGELALRLRGSGRKYSPERQAVDELVAERGQEDQP